jgi:flavin reductase (DIM6/NTAB) family NADH-FMN oxidoreductase RutF
MSTLATQPATAEGFRQALRRLASGVTVVASIAEDGTPRGIVMTAVMSLSFDPPSMLIAINRSASLLPAVGHSGRFSINVLGSDSKDWCHAFATSDVGERFAADDWIYDDNGVPLLRAALSSIVCDVDQAEPFGSHMVIRGLVRNTHFRQDTDGLIYLDGRYARPRTFD